MEETMTLDKLSDKMDGLSDKYDVLSEKVDGLSVDMGRLSEKMSTEIEKFARMVQAGFVDILAKMATKEDLARVEHRLDGVENRLDVWARRTVEVEDKVDSFAEKYP